MAQSILGAATGGGSGSKFSGSDVKKVYFVRDSIQTSEVRHDEIDARVIGCEIILR